MRPMGRKKTLHNCKWKVKENGKNVKGWWEDVIEPNKALEKRMAKAEIERDISLASLSSGVLDNRASTRTS